MTQSVQKMIDFTFDNQIQEIKEKLIMKIEPQAITKLITIA